jgi:hypothetical protein
MNEWLPDPTRDNLRLLVSLYVLLFGGLFVLQWRARFSVGLPLAFGLVLAVNYLAGAWIYCFDYYIPRSVELTSMNFSFKDTFAGFTATVWGFTAFFLGVLAVSLFRGGGTKVSLRRHWIQVGDKLPGTLLCLAFLIFFLAPILKRIPSMSSIWVSGSNFAVLAVVLYAYLEYRGGRMLGFLRWFAASTFFPVMTVAFLGFAGYGIVAASNAWQMMLRFFKPRIVGILLLVSVIYSGLSVYQAYMRERGNIREAVWGSRSMGRRLTQMQRVITNFEWFNPYDHAHLEIIDVRLNQNDLTGKAIDYINSGRVGYANGGTLAAAAVSWVPRILWPNKPKTGGSGSLVSMYTGMKFGDGTSIGAGLVMELYINYGIWCVAIGFLVLGVVVTLIDQRAGAYMRHGDYWGFVRCALPGLALISPGGALTEVVGGASASAVLVFALHRFVFQRFYFGDSVLVS